MAHDKPLGYFLLASRAEAGEFKQVAVYFKSCLPGETLLGLFQLTTGEINDFVAVGADQVVMMPCCARCVAAAVISSV